VNTEKDDTEKMSNKQRCSYSEDGEPCIFSAGHDGKHHTAYAIAARHYHFIVDVMHDMRRPGWISRKALLKQIEEHLFRRDS
jgi:hypothetical protein